MSARHERHKCNTSDRSTTRVPRKCDTTDTSATQKTQVRHEWKIWILITMQVKTSFWINTILYETNNNILARTIKKISKMNVRFSKKQLNWKWGHVGQFSEFCLRQQLFAFKEFCMETRLSNILNTKNVTKLTKAIVESSYRVLQITSKWKVLK